MLMQMLRSLIGNAATPAAGADGGYPVAELRKRIRLFENAPVDTHLDILYRDCRSNPMAAVLPQRCLSLVTRIEFRNVMHLTGEASGSVSRRLTEPFAPDLVALRLGSIP